MLPPVVNLETTGATFPRQVTLGVHQASVSVFWYETGVPTGWKKTNSIYIYCFSIGCATRTVCCLRNPWLRWRDPLGDVAPWTSTRLRSWWSYEFVWFRFTFTVNILCGRFTVSIPSVYGRTKDGNFRVMQMTVINSVQLTSKWFITALCLQCVS